MKSEASKYTENFNILCCPCVSPWGYEHIQRWSATAVDPNRSFKSPSPCDEAGAVVELMASMNLQWTMHTDLHETTDSDFTEFVPAKAARDGHKLSNDPIPVSINPMDCPGGAKAKGIFESICKEENGKLSFEQCDHIALKDYKKQTCNNGHDLHLMHDTPPAYKQDAAEKGYKLSDYIICGKCESETWYTDGIWHCNSGQYEC